MKTKITYNDVFRYFDQRTNDEFGKELSAAFHKIREKEKELFSDDSESTLLEAIEIRAYSQKLANANYLVGSDLDARVCEYAGAEALGIIFQLLEHTVKRQLQFSERVKVAVGIMAIGKKHYFTEQKVVRVMAGRKKLSAPTLAELSKKIDEQIERLDSLTSQYLEASSVSLQYSLRWKIKSAQRTIDENRKLLRKIDGENV